MTTRLLPRSRLLRVSLLAFGLLASCAWLPMTVDRSARAPLLDGYGESTLAITSASESARRLFAQGMAQAYAFNEAEAVRSFKAALAADPDCALCAWGVAYQMGPTINEPDRGDLREAVRYVDLALARSKSASPRDRALIEALALRYGHASLAKEVAVVSAPVCGQGGTERAHPLDIAYAERLRGLVERFPADPDVLSMYAEAEMVATRGDWWDPDSGKAQGRIGELATLLEVAAQRFSQHTGINHYLIHAVDAPGVAERALPAAERLGALAPKSPHLVHMPSHIFGLTGRYAQASAVNQQALALDDALKANLAEQGFAVSKDWRGHNGSYLWFAALMEGRGEVALTTARAAAERAAQADHEFGEYRRSLPILTLLRLGRWEALLAEPLPTGVKDAGKGMATVLGQQARGVALARLGRVAEASQALALLSPAADKLIAAHPGASYADKTLRGLAGTAQSRLRAEIAQAEGHVEAALKFQAEAIRAGQFIDRAEPPMLAAGSTLVLGEMKLQAKRWAEAEQSFRADLAAHPNSGWALRGLVLSLQGRGQGGAELTALKAALASNFAAADPEIKRLN